MSAFVVCNNTDYILIKKCVALSTNWGAKRLNNNKCKTSNFDLKMFACVGTRLTFGEWRRDFWWLELWMATTTQWWRQWLLWSAALERWLRRPGAQSCLPGSPTSSHNGSLPDCAPPWAGWHWGSKWIVCRVHNHGWISMRRRSVTLTVEKYFMHRCVIAAWSKLVIMCEYNAIAHAAPVYHRGYCATVHSHGQLCPKAII